MDKKVHMSPKDFFLYVGAMITLYVSVFSLIALLFQYIDVLFPDRLDYYYDPYSAAIRWQMASLIIIFPVFLFVTRLLNKDIQTEPAKKELGIRKWLIYITLFVAGAAVLIDLIALLNTFLGGELTTRFALKVIVVLVVVGDVFIYYFFDLKGRWEKKPAQARAGMLVWAVVVASAVIGGFFIMGSPTTQRELRFDQRKVNDLQSIQWQVVNYWQQKGVLPTAITDLEDPISGFVLPVDPETDEPYGYRTTGALSFELCADFNKESSGKEQGAIYPRAMYVEGPSPAGIKGDTWEHGLGEECFERTIDPDLYPPREKVQP